MQSLFIIVASEFFRLVCGGGFKVKGIKCPILV